MFTQTHMLTRRLTRLSTTRHYQSLAMSLNQRNHTPLSTPKIKEPTSHLQHTLSTMKKQTPKQQKMKTSLDFLRSFLGKAYTLKEETLLMAAYPEKQYTTQDADSSITSQALEKLGETTLKLQLSKFLLQFGTQVSTDEIQVFDSKLYQKFHKPQALTTFITEKGLLKNTHITQRREQTPQKAAHSALYILIGGVCHTYDKAAAEKFIDSAIIRGKGGLLEIASRL